MSTAPRENLGSNSATFNKENSSKIFFKEMEGIKFHFENDLATLTLNRPDKHNALSVQILKNLKELIKSLIQNKELKPRALFIKGEGDKSFCSGADISELVSMDTQDAYNYSLLGQHVTLLIERLPFPVFALVNGFTFGGGFEIALACDYIFSTPISSFAFPELKLGLIPGFGGTQRLSRILGRQKAKDIIFTGKAFTAQSLFDLGLIYQICSSPMEMEKSALLKVEEMKDSSPTALHIAKKVINLGLEMSFLEGLNLEMEEFSELFKTFDKKEGLEAFQEKRAPHFSGRNIQKDEIL